MIFVFIEDGTLDVIDALADALREYEGIDVESGVFEFYDENGIYLKPVFSVPNKYESHLFGLIKSVESGVYGLIPAPNECEKSFEIMLGDVQILNENKYFSSLGEIRARYNVTT